jgi:hypothetical protein
MSKMTIIKGFIRDPLEWAADCQLRACATSDPEARAAFSQLAEEFASAASEIDGLIGTVEALSKHTVDA